MNPVTKEIPVSELEEVKILVREARFPKVTFSSDMEKMQKEASDRTYEALCKIENWICVQTSRG